MINENSTECIFNQEKNTEKSATEERKIELTLVKNERSEHN